MKRKSLIFKITIWFSAAVIIISGAAVFVTLAISRAVLQRGIREELVKTVENNFDEIEFYNEYDRLEFDDPYDLYIEYKNGFLEIDDDFVRSVNGISTALYDESGLIYGDDSYFTEEQRPDFRNKTVSSVKTQQGRYYVYDLEMNVRLLDSPLWLRGTVSADYSISQVNMMTKAVLLMIPLLVLLAIVGGRGIAKRALSPIIDIKNAAEDIRSGTDLSKRIEIGEGCDEVHSMADAFNGMFERLEDSFNKEQQLTSDISHELRTPVSVISAQCQYSLENDNTKEEYTEALELIERQSKKMSRVINDMLAFSRIERGAGGIPKERLDLSECVSAVCGDMELINEKGITLGYSIEPDIFINGNYELITRMAVNLISNAYRYGKENGKTQVSLKSENENAVLTVRDNGIGMDEETVSKIWDRFYRADSSRSDGGTGLGLSFVREIAEIHGAKASVESQKGVGSEFKIIFKKI
ncbi:MAG: ATP-binding protein [Acutalibacteraceae bacterium]|nr:HAMP domain-containing sensor histidine kinase [Oscillospiraceae bacterium]